MLNADAVAMVGMKWLIVPRHRFDGTVGTRRSRRDVGENGRLTLLSRRRDIGGWAGALSRRRRRRDAVAADEVALSRDCGTGSGGGGGGGSSL